MRHGKLWKVVQTHPQLPVHRKKKTGSRLAVGDLPRPIFFGGGPKGAAKPSVRNRVSGFSRDLFLGPWGKTGWDHSGVPPAFLPGPPFRSPFRSPLPLPSGPGGRPHRPGRRPSGTCPCRACGSGPTGPRRRARPPSCTCPRRGCPRADVCPGVKGSTCVRASRS